MKTNSKPLSMEKKVKIIHIDGISEVLAKAVVKNKEVEFEYRFNGMSYGQTLSFEQCIEKGYVKKVKANNNFRDMKSGVIYPIISFDYSEDDMVCNRGDMLIKIPVNGGSHISNFDIVL